MRTEAADPQQTRGGGGLRYGIENNRPQNTSLHTFRPVGHDPTAA